MAKSPRPTGTRTPRKPATRSRLGLPEKPDSASRRLRTRRDPAEDAAATASASSTSPTAESPSPDPAPAPEPTVPDAPQASVPPEPSAPSSPDLAPAAATEAAPAAAATARGRRGRKPAAEKPAEVAPKSGRARKAGDVPAGGKTAGAAQPPDKEAPAETPVAAERPDTPATSAIPAAGGLGIAGALGEELAAFSRRLIEDSNERARELVAARSLSDLVEIQARQLQAVSDAWLQHSARMRAIYLEALENTPHGDRR